MNEASGLKIKFNPLFEKVNEIANTDTKACVKGNRCGCLGAVPGGDHYMNGAWLADAVWVFNDSLIYFYDQQETERYLFSEYPDALGVIPYFAQLQEKDGEHAGNIPVARYNDGVHSYNIDFGGMFDLSYEPRVNHRDETPAGAFFIHGMYRHWKFFNNISYFTKYFDVSLKFMEYKNRFVDESTGLFKSTYGLGDVCIDRAVRESTALIRVNGECYRMFKSFSEMAEASGKVEAAEKYKAVAEKMRQGINEYLWNKERKRYEIKLFCSPTENEESPAYGITEDDRFFVEGNMAYIFRGIPDSEEKSKSLIGEIDRVSTQFDVDGLGVYPAYPNGWHNKIFDDDNYWNGDIWPAFASWYSIGLFRLGYAERALDVLNKQAKLVERDGGFYEYYEADETLKGKGCNHYGFTTAPFQRALVEGLFGVDADYTNGKVFIHPSLKTSGSIIAQIGLHKFEVDININEAGNVKLSVNSTYSGTVDFRVLIKSRINTCKVADKFGKDIASDIVSLEKENYVNFTYDVQADNNIFDIICN